MRTLAFSHIADPGGPVHTLRPALEMLEQRGQVSVAVPGPGSLASELAPLEVLDEPGYAALALPSDPTRLPSVLLRSARDCWAVWRLMRRLNPDLVVVSTATLPFVLLAARMRRTPTILYAAELLGPEFREGSSAKRFVRRLILRASDILSDAVVVPSKLVGDQYRSATTVIEPSIADRYSRGDPTLGREQCRATGEERIILAAGNLTHGRGQDLLLRSFPAVLDRYPNSRLCFAGAPFGRTADEAYAAELDELASRLRVADRVTFLGHVASIENVLAAADVVVNPARVGEAFGRVAYEALAAGTPVVATRLGALACGDLPGVTVAADDNSEALAGAIIACLAEPETAERGVATAKQFVLSRLTPARYIEQFAGVVTAVTRKGAGA